MGPRNNWSPLIQHSHPITSWELLIGQSAEEEHPFSVRELLLLQHWTMMYMVWSVLPEILLLGTSYGNNNPWCAPLLHPWSSCLGRLLAKAEVTVHHVVESSSTWGMRSTNHQAWQISVPIYYYVWRWCSKIIMCWLGVIRNVAVCCSCKSCGT